MYIYLSLFTSSILQFSRTCLVPSQMARSAKIEAIGFQFNNSNCDHIRILATHLSWFAPLPWILAIEYVLTWMDLDLPMKIPYFFRTGILIALISIPLVLSNPSLHQWFTGQTSLSTKYFQTQNQALDKTEEQDYKGEILAYSKALKIGE